MRLDTVQANVCLLYESKVSTIRISEMASKSVNNSWPMITVGIFSEAAYVHPKIDTAETFGVLIDLQSLRCWRKHLPHIEQHALP